MGVYYFSVGVGQILAMFRTKIKLLAMGHSIYREVHLRVSVLIKVAGMAGMLIGMGNPKKNIKYGVVFEVSLGLYAFGYLNYLLNYLVGILIYQELRSHKAVNYGPLTLFRLSSSLRPSRESRSC